MFCHVSLRATVCPLFIVLCCALAAGAQETRIITVEECLTRASERALALKAQAAKTEAAASRARAASRRLNPKLEAEVENFAGTEGNEGLRAAETTLSLAQEIELGGKRRLRAAAAEAETAVSRAEEAVLRHEVLFATRKAALDVLVAQERVRFSEALLALAREAEAAALSREKAGKTTALDTERARAEAGQAALEAEERASDQRDAVRGLALVMGETEPTFDAVAGALEAPPADLPGLDALLLQGASHPALLAAEAQTRTFEAQARAEDAGRLPNLELAAGVRRFEENDGYGLVAGVGVELPLVNRSRDTVRAAQAEAEAAKLEATDARLKNEGTLRRLYARLQVLAAKDKRLRESVIPSAERALAFVKRAHEQGKAGYLDVLEARRTLAQSQLGLIEARADYQATRLDLDERAAAPAPLAATALQVPSNLKESHE